MGFASQGMPVGRTTLLEAVCILLTNIGEQPVDSLEGEQVQDSRIAERTILEFHKEGQTRGWSWNREYQFPFERDLTTGEVVIPANVISFAVNPYWYDGRFVPRGQRIYDKVQRSYQIPAEAAPIPADVTWLLPWDESPESFNRYATIRAARVFAARALAASDAVSYTALDEQAALAELLRVEAQQSQPNSLTGGPGFSPFPTYSPGMGLIGRRSAAGANYGF